MKDAVVLVHGLWMSGWVLTLQRWRLKRCGYEAYLFSYPSVRRDLSQNAARLREFIGGLPEQKIYLVGHSLGGLIIAAALQQSADPRIKRVVLMGSPYSECQAGRGLGRFEIGRRMLGKSLPQWIFGERGEWKSRIPVGVISGCRPWGLGMLFTRFKEPHDGVVTVEETKVPGMSAQVVLDIGHTAMMFSAAVIEQACHFLKHERFAEESQARGVRMKDEG